MHHAAVHGQQHVKTFLSVRQQRAVFESVFENCVSAFRTSDSTVSSFPPLWLGARGGSLHSRPKIGDGLALTEVSAFGTGYAMRQAAATILVFLSGFAIMVLEIIGARFLAKDFGGSFYVWVSQIGVVLMALALGYYAGGALADRWARLSCLSWLLIPAGLATWIIPDFGGRIVAAIVQRHPVDRDIPLLWQKLDPALGSAVIFGFPCFVLATLPPFMIRLATTRLAHVGKISGLMIAASTVGGIAGVFVSGYILIDHLALSHIFRGTGALTIFLGGICWWMDRTKMTNDQWLMTSKSTILSSRQTSRLCG